MYKETTKEAIFTALMLLMEQKDYDKITITAIVRKAGVSRMSFYRIYNSKEDILLEAVNRFFGEFQNKWEGMNTDRFIIEFSNKIMEYKNLIIGLEKAGCDDKLFDILLKHYKIIYKEKYLGDKPLSQKDILILNYHTGGIQKMIKYWASIDFSISVDEIIEACKELLPETLL